MIHRKPHVRFESRAGAGAEHRRSLGATALAPVLPSRMSADFFQMFRNTQRVVTLYSQRRATSRPGHRQGQAPSSIATSPPADRQAGRLAIPLTGQPMRWAGREVGGLANQLAGIWGLRRRISTASAGLEGAAHRYP